MPERGCIENVFDKPDEQRPSLLGLCHGEKTKAKSTFSISQMRNAELARALAWRENEGRANVLSTPISRCVRMGIILTSVRYSSLHSMGILPFRGWLYHTARNSIQVCGYGRMSIR